MLQLTEQLRISDYTNLYDVLIPKDNLLRQFKELVNFNFVVDELKSKYCLDNGRNAIPPIRLFKYLLLKTIYCMSDRDLVERSRYDMSLKYSWITCLRTMLYRQASFRSLGSSD